MDPKTKARIFGIVALLIGLGGTAYNWYSALTVGVYWPKSSFLFPVFALLGLSIFLYPTSKAENLEKYGTEQMPLKHYPLGQKVLIAIGLLLGALDFALLSGVLH